LLAGAGNVEEHALNAPGGAYAAAATGQSLMDARTTGEEGASSVPCGFDSRRLPIGLQIVGRPWEDATVLDFADRYQRHTNERRTRVAPAPMNPNKTQ
jgi:Asp-tRNA(Asn)/Glu-tRNA(Gln) amidotransferase A subunit family amidase